MEVSLCLIEIRLRLHYLTDNSQHRQKARLIFDLPGPFCRDYKKDAGQWLSFKCSILLLYSECFFVCDSIGFEMIEWPVVRIFHNPWMACKTSSTSAAQRSKGPKAVIKRMLPIVLCKLNVKGLLRSRNTRDATYQTREA
jgi:hypothetical protein